MLTRGDVRKRFEAELRSRGASLVATVDGRYQVTADGGISVLVSLENLERDVVRDGKTEAISNFVDRVLSRTGARSWSEASHSIYMSAEPSNYEFGDTIRSPVSHGVSLVLTLFDVDRHTIEWVTPGHLKQWGVSQAAVELAARENLDGLLKGRTLKVDEVGGRKLGMVPLHSSYSPYKASVIFAPGFRQFVEPQLGWPVLAVTPCRDFIYLFAEGDFDLVGRAGRVVLEEYENSPYPITTEVWKISDAGVEAIGKLGGSETDR